VADQRANIAISKLHQLTSSKETLNNGFEAEKVDKRTPYSLLHTFSIFIVPLHIAKTFKPSNRR